ncbi:MAG: carboxypeptidase regulatory-like domain-containing protein, partial [Thermoplasmata archaeon]
MALRQKERQNDEPADRTSKETSSSGNAISSGIRGLKNNQWLKENWWVIVTLIVFFALGVFLRAYFYWDVAVVDNGFLLTGNDPDYHKVVIDGIQSTHHQPQIDPAMNYPLGGLDHNPALFEWSIALLGYVFAPFFGGDLALATWYVFEMSPAFWGGMLVFPVYALAREMFGKKAGILAAFLIATMSSNIERSAVGYADHDAFVLFFIVLTFFFFMRALKELKLRNYVADWRKMHEIRDGFAKLLAENKVSIGYALMSGTALATVALAWKGFPYVMVIMAFYFVVQMFVNVFKKVDSFSTFVVTTFALGIPLLIIYPYYAAAGFLSPWFKDPIYIFLAVSILGLYMSTTRDAPSIVSMGVLAGIIAAAYAVLHFQFPAIEKELISGMGYFVQSKIYETIAEAQPSDYSRLVFSFGIATFYIAIVGVAYLLYRYPKDQHEHSLFMLVWAVAGVYMALSAVRFMANATPLFAILAAWVTYEVVKHIDYRSFVRAYRSMAGGGRFNALKKSLKPLHVLGVLFVAGLVIIPNVYYGLDAAIPYENKKEFDKKIYESFPEGDVFGYHVSMRPPKDKYNVSERNQLWYLGAFGMSMPQDYWVDGLRWLAEQDNQSELMQKPAFVSWWDYGHWARHMGKHPTVSDNFQEGVQISGNMIAAQNESQEIAFFIVRIVESEPTSAGMREILLRYLDEDSVNRLVDIYKNPSKYKKEILADPEFYTPRTKDLSNENAKYVAAAMLLSHKLDVDKLAELYHDVCTYTGYSIRYFAVDSRLFPFSATNTGIYYAPIKLSDQNIDDFMVVRAVSENGIEYPPDDVPSGVKIVDYKLIYKEPFYNSMFYKTYIGYSGNDLSMGDAGIPGLSGQLAQYAPMQGWMMKHFRIAYRTAYYNPHNYTDVKNHTEDWKAISYERANELDKNGDSLVDEGDGVVDRRGGLYQGVFILKYYDGAIVSGRVMTEDGKPIANARVTCYDDSGLEGVIPGIPHDSVLTDENGNYSIIVPYGNVTLITSIGGLDTTNPMSMLLQMESTPINSTNVNVTDDQAMRRTKSLNPDGTPDWQIKKDIIVKAGSLEGKIFFDKNANNEFDSDVDELIKADANSIKLVNTNGYITKEALANETANGTYKFDQVIMGTYKFILNYKGHEIEFSETISIESDTTTTKDIYFQPASISGTIEHQNGTLAKGETVKLIDKANNEIIEKKTDENGTFEFADLLPGNYTVYVSVPGYKEILEDRLLAAGDTQTVNITLVQASTVTGILSLANNPLENARIEFRSNYDGSIVNVSITNASGAYKARLPKGKYTITSRYTKNEENYILLDEIEVDGTAQGIEKHLELQRAVKVSGTVYYDFLPNGKIDYSGVETESGSEVISNAQVEFETENGALMKVPSNATGYYQIYLPAGEYTLRASVKIGGTDYSYLDSINVESQPITRDISMLKAVRISGSVYYDKDKNKDANDFDNKIANAKVTFVDPAGRSIYTYSGEGMETGFYVAYLPPGRIYTAVVEKEGFETLHEYLDIINENKTIDLYANAQNRSISGTLWYDADNDGTFDENEKLQGIQFAIKFEPVESSGAVAAEAISDLSGKFTLANGLSPGIYAVVCSKLVQENGIDVKYIYNETVEIYPANAEFVYNMSMIRGIKVTGTVRSENLVVQPQIPVTFWGEKTYETVSDGLGNYEIYVKPGEYSVCVYATPSTPMSYVHLSNVTITESMTYDITLEQGVRVSGDLVYEEDTLFNNAEVIFASNGKMKTATDINGHYSMLVPPNRNYTIYVNYIKNETNEEAEG